MRKKIKLLVMFGLSLGIMTGCGGGSRLGLLEEIDPKVAQTMYTSYLDNYRKKADGTIDPDATIRVGFSRDDIQKLLNSMDKAEATGVNVYFGAKVDNSGKLQKTVFFQPAMFKGNIDGHKSYDDLPFTKANPHNVGHPCPPPRCDGKTNYTD